MLLRDKYGLPKQAAVMVYRPQYRDQELWIDEVRFARNFARRAGVRSAALMLRDKGWSLRETVRVLARVEVQDAAFGEY